jgi:hypothetical protein
VAELVDAPDLGSGARKGVGVRVPPCAFRDDPDDQQNEHPVTLLTARA